MITSMETGGTGQGYMAKVAVYMTKKLSGFQRQTFF
jgi:hypothetical protein